MDFANLVYEQKPFDGVFVFDVHGHIGFEQGSQLGPNDGESMVHTMDRLGVDGICVSFSPGIRGAWKRGNDQTKDTCKRLPSRVFGYAVPNPFYQDCDLSPYFEEDLGFRGVKIHGNIQGETPENDPRYAHAFELANRLKLPVLFHAWLPYEVDRAADVARQYPDLNVIIGHGGLTFAREHAVAACKKYDNVFCDTAISSAPDGSIEWLVDKIGVDKVLYGSDMSFFDCIHTLGKIALCKLSDTEKEKILGLNAKPLFGL